MPIRVHIACPEPPPSRRGNRVTALRWARILRELGARVRIEESYAGQETDLLVALHARRSASAARAFARLHPERPLIVALTGTDLYADLDRHPSTHAILELADRLILLQDAGRAQLTRRQRSKARVIHQSVQPLQRRVARSLERFDVAVVGHLRAVKDPFRTAMAVRDLPADSRLRVQHLGTALTPSMRARALAETERNPRYRWLGERTRNTTLQWIARSHLLVLSSRLEGGANVIGEAATLGVPILASRIEGTIGLLGNGYPGFFEVGDTKGLRTLLLRAELDTAFYKRLREATQSVARLFRPERERRAWRDLLRELT